MSYKQVYPSCQELYYLLVCTLGKDRNIHIEPPVCVDCYTYNLTINVRLLEQARAIRVIVPDKYRYGNYVICTTINTGCQVVCDGCPAPKNQREVATIFCTALRTNPLFGGVILEPQSCIPVCSKIEVCIAKYQCMNGIWAADAFAQVLRIRYGLIIETEVCFRTHVTRPREECLYCTGYVKEPYPIGIYDY